MGPKAGGVNHSHLSGRKTQHERLSFPTEKGWWEGGGEADFTHLVAGVIHGEPDLEIWVRLWDGIPVKLQSTWVWESVSLQAGKWGSCPLAVASASRRPLRDSPAHPRQVTLPAKTCLSSHVPRVSCSLSRCPATRGQDSK